MEIILVLNKAIEDTIVAAMTNWYRKIGKEKIIYKLVKLMIRFKPIATYEKREENQFPLLIIVFMYFI